MKDILVEGKFDFTVLPAMHGNEAIINVRAGKMRLTFCLNEKQINEFVEAITSRNYVKDKEFAVPVQMRPFTLTTDKPRKSIQLSEKDLNY